MSRSSEVAILTTAASEFEAGVIVAALREEGIEAHYFLGGLHYYMGSVASSLLSLVQVVVPNRDLQRAREILLAHRRESATIDWETVDVGEAEQITPKIRSHKAGMLWRGVQYTAAIVLIGLIVLEYISI